MQNPAINELLAIRRRIVSSYLSVQNERELRSIFAKLYCLLDSDVPADDHLQEKIKLLLDNQYDLKVIKYRNYEEDWQKREFQEALRVILSIYKNISYAEFAPNKLNYYITYFIIGFVASWIAFI